MYRLDFYLSNLFLLWVVYNIVQDILEGRWYFLTGDILFAAFFFFLGRYSKYKWQEEKEHKKTMDMQEENNERIL